MRARGDAEKQGGIDVYQVWEPETIVDEADSCAITVSLPTDRPFLECITDLTPRRYCQFKAKPTERFAWTCTDPAYGKVLHSGTANADEWGLVTVKGLVLTKDAQRVTLRGH